MDRLIDNSSFQKVKESWFLLMVPLTKEVGKMEWCMDLEFINGKMDQNMKVFMSMEKNKEMESFIIHLENNTLECGRMGNNKAKVK